jgi:hypothetical protein
VITPICPHVLTNRSVIVGDTSVIEVEASEPDSPVFLTLDGRSPVPLEFWFDCNHPSLGKNAATRGAARTFILRRRPPKVEMEREYDLTLGRRASFA